MDTAASVSLCIDRNEVPLLCGPVGCGKSSIIDFLAKFRHAKTLKMQISEQTDTKALLGAYCCSNSPGVFIWRPGCLTHCMNTGKWLILEDVDKGSADLPILLSPLLRSGKDSSSQVIHPNTGEPILRHPDFRLILTLRTISSPLGYSDYASQLDIYLNNCSVIYMNGMPADIIEQIIQKYNPNLVPLARRLLSGFSLLKHIGTPSGNNQRTVCSRDFFKFISRIRNTVDGSKDSALELYLNALDCFVCSQTPSSAQDEVAVHLGGLFNFTREEASKIWLSRRPELCLNRALTRVEAGRAIIPIRKSIHWELQLTKSPSTQVFADTRLACTLVERLAVAVSNSEPVLLVGETGTGKTSSIQHLALMAGRRLRVLNLNQQSDSVDLLGGFKPVDSRALINPLREKFESLFVRTFRLESNRNFLGHIQSCATAGRWLDLLTLLKHPATLAIRKLSAPQNKETETITNKDDSGSGQQQKATLEEWQSLLAELETFESRLSASSQASENGGISSTSFAFAFIEGTLVRSLEKGDWLLLDEINLAPAELLDCLACLLDSSRGSVTLIDRGDLEPVRRHPDFHLFAAMNPSTDVGKRDLPMGLRNRFTEIRVAELEPGTSSADREDLALLIRTYLVALSPTASQVSAVVQLYAALKQAANERLIDGVGQRPCFSLRTLCRALTEASRGYHGSFLRSLYEGFYFSFGSQVGRASRPLLERLIISYLLTTTKHSPGTKNDKAALARQFLSKPLPQPPLRDGDRGYVQVEGYWVPQGPLKILEEKDDAVRRSYVLTETVRGNLKDLARVVSAAGSLPVLLQGETSVGKTSLITFLAARVGQVCHRINNHEHTDLQTYLGAYTAASATSACKNAGNGSGAVPLVFQEGIFVQAMKQGHWIILDELNLAPTEILEALNRVLDENRELFITETQEMVKAHPHFRVFATQNPPGLYAGRKVLSRALRNRFVELHFDALPRAELEVILEHRSALPRSRAAKMVEVMHQLHLIRRSSDIFRGKDGFITLRDLFRWGERYRLATCNQGKENELFDWDAYLAEQGYLLLAGRARYADEAKAVADVIQKVFKKQVHEENLYDKSENTSAAAAEFLSVIDNPLGGEFDHVVWTRDMRRLLVLVGNALKYNEPILLVGETGCGKTTICQIFAALRKSKLLCVNCHQYTEAADFLGGLRPIRTHQSDDPNTTDDRLFEWVDGPLVLAMVQGDVFLLDEISLADDAVLERINSLLEPERKICLAERCGDSLESEEITAVADFRLLATMNPGGDYAKKELSPALRNRFTEIWCPSPTFTAEKSAIEMNDWQAIVEHNMRRSDLLVDLTPLAKAIVDFCWWFAQGRTEVIRGGMARKRRCRRPFPTIRDLLSWVEFMRNLTTSRHDFSRVSIFSACLHGAALIFLDSLEEEEHSPDEQIEHEPYLFVDKSSFQTSPEKLYQFSPVGGINFLLRCLIKHFEVKESNPHLLNDIKAAAQDFVMSLNLQPGQCVPELKDLNRLYGCEPFFIETGPELLSNELVGSRASINFSLSAVTPASNLCRLLRALQLPKRALLLEGSPGVGKTSLVSALARAAGHRVVRINLSEATEASDLFGCDLPVEGAGCGTFAWCDGPLLQALRHGHWVLLDEMNLASQSVLECLNACLDHRGSIYIPELGTTFYVKPRATRLFACQNPVEEGGGRRALPKSFLNRFTQVYLKPLTTSDQMAILINVYNDLPVPHIEAMVKFNSMLQDAVERGDSFNAVAGTSWEFNLRDLCRWGDLLTAGQADFGTNPGLYVYLLYAARMRSNEDRTRVIELWNDVAEETGLGRCYIPRGCTHPLIENKIQIGLSTWSVNLDESRNESIEDGLLILNQHRPYLEMLLKILQHGWMSILIGPRGAGKRSLVHLAAQIVRRHVATVALSPSADTVELLGAFEQHENGGIFAWIDSPLVRGIREGHWVVLENAQLCSPSVLDRLNSLLEPGGDLLISERGLDANGNLVRLKPHSEFRLILVVDDNTPAVASYSNNISRAMRNRGVEMVLTNDLTFHKEDLQRLLLNTGLSPACVNALLTFESSVIQRLHAISPEVTTSSLPPRKPPVGALLSAARVIQQIIISKELDALMGSEGGEEITEDIAPWMVKWKGEDSRKKAFAKSLIDVYSRRQTDHNVSQVLTKAICYFVDYELPTLLESDQTPLRPRLNRVSELLSSISPLVDQWRHVLDYCSTVLSPSDNSLLPIIVRLSVERGFKIPSSTESLSIKQFALSIKEVDNIDLRWIPGWTCIVNRTSEDLLSTWNSRIVDAFLSTLKSFHDRVLFTSSSLTFNDQIPVICALDHFVKGDIPIAFSEAYPGLQGLYSGLLSALSSLRETFYNCGHGHFDFRRFLAALAKLTAWLQQFGSQPIGSASDWSERIEFFAHYCRSSQAGVAAAVRLMELIRRYLQAPVPKSTEVPKRLDICHLPWAKLALAAQDQISTLLMNPMNVDEMDKAMEVPDLPSSETSESMRLWPILATGLVFGRHRDASFTEWSENMSKNLLVELGIQLGALSRPRLLTLFTLSSEKSSESITDVLHLGNRAFSSLELSDPSGLVKPDFVHEWRSLSQAVFAVNHADSMSSHSDGANCSFADWISHQQILSDLFHLLQKLVPLSIKHHRISHSVDSEIPELIGLSRSLFCAILAAIHKRSLGKLSDDSPAIARLSEVIASLSEDNVEVFADTVDSHMSRFLSDQPLLLRLLRAYCACLKASSRNREEAIARAWVFYGALQMQCAFPASPLDPSIVNAFKATITRDELLRLETDLKVRAVIRSIEVGSCGLPCIGTNLLLSHTGCVDTETVQSNVEAGLEHPLVGAIVQRRSKVARRLERLEERQVVKQDHAALQLRATSNSHYVELRRRLTAFNQNFTGDFLLNLLENGTFSRSGTLQQWIETAASLSEWFIQPQRLHVYADVVEPYLLGIVKVVHGLRTLVQLEASRDENATNFVSLVESLSTGMFPTLATNTTASAKGLPLTPCLQLIRHLVSPQIRGLLHRSIWKDRESDIGVLSGRSIYIDTRDVLAHRREVSILKLETEYRMNSHILNLIIMDRLSSTSLTQHHVDFISRLLKALTGYLCLRWRRREARRKRDAERRAALFIEAEQRRRKCYSELQSAASAISSSKNIKKKKGETRAEHRKRVQEASENKELPELIDAGLNDEVEWRLRFSETGAIEARKALTLDSGDFEGLRLSKEDAIQQAVRSIEGVNSWFEKELANTEVETEAESEWLPGDEELVGFVDRLVFVLLHLSQRDLRNDNYLSLAEKHWWRTFIEGYQFAGHLLAHSRYQLPVTSDDYSMPSHLLVTARFALTARDDSESVELEKIFSFEPLQYLYKDESVMSVTRRKRCLDVYRDPIPKSEGRKAYTTMVAVRARVLQLLQEWPDHPALKKIITVINRMCTFSMNDCLTKYITAFEMLLAEMQEWERNASRHVSISEAFRSVCDLLIEWRKLELKCWMASLDTSTESAANSCASLWFHLQSVFLQPTSSASIVEEDQCQILLEFMENGPVGEFPARWRLLAALYSAIAVWPGLSDTYRLSARRMVGNVAWFYGQFIPHVKKFLLDEQKPIRKEMSNFISAMKWGDYISFWTMKENVDKCKKTIHKHIRTWEGILRQSVKPCFDAAIKTSIEMPVPDTALTILEHIQSIEKKDFGVFKLSLEMKTWLSKLAEEREMPVNIRRLPILTKRFKAHIICISKAAPCLSWIQQLCECLGDWMKRIKELSRSTQQLDSESPPAKALIAVLNEKETYRDSKSKDINEEDLKKAKDWSSRYTALQQNKKLALHDWFRLSFGRRQLKFTQKALRTEDEPYLSDNDLSEIPLSDGEVSKDECDMCLGLSYRRGLRKSLFEKPRSQLMLKLGGDLWSFSTNPPPVFIKHLEQLISLASISQLQKMASESLARLLSLRSGLPKHPDKSEVVDDLGGRQGVERLIGSLDDLLVNCVDAFEPFGDLYSTFQKLKEKVEEIHFTYNKGVASNSMIPCSRQFMRKLKASRDRVANLASSCIQQWNKFTETCSSLSIPPSQSLNRLLDANSDYFPTETTTCDVTKVFIDFKSRLEYLSNRLDQRIPRSSIAITKDIIDQQELLKVAAQEFVQCCQEITTQTRVDTGLLSVANSLHSEVEASNELLSIARKSGTQTPDFEKRVSSIISKTLVALQCLKHLDESVEVERGMIDQLKNCASALPESCISKLEVINSSIDKLSPSCVNDILHIQSITPLLASLLNVVSLRLRHLLGLLISWLGLGEFLAQVAFRLLNEGFCKPSALQKAFEAGAPGKEGADRENNNSAANENDEGGCTSINAEGVDTSGAKDVSKELQSQEQIEGTTDHHQSREEDRNELPPEADDNGIEMPDDFDAAFDDGSGREEKDPNKDDVLDQEEDDLQDVDEQMGEAGDQPDEFNQEMWASDGEEETEEEDEKNRENADMDEGGVQDDSRSKSSKSTAVNEEPDDKSAKNDAREPEEESEVNEDGEDTTTGAKEKDFSSAANANKSETVAGSENKEEGEVEEKEMANAMKDDENRLASQEAELLETEKQNEEEVEGTDDDSMDAFGENMDLEPNPEEFEDMDEYQWLAAHQMNRMAKSAGEKGVSPLTPFALSRDVCRNIPPPFNEFESLFYLDSAMGSILGLQCWMASLDTSTESAANSCASLWFHLQSVFLQPTSSASIVEEDQCQILLEFMENGPVGEFPARWRLLAALYSAIAVWPGLSDTYRLSARRMVGNVAWFYGQFIPHVKKFLLDEQKPIRKEMSNFISAMKWGDYISFWTMKENVDKCKKTIHKHIRTWEGILRQSVKPCFDAAIKTSIEMPVPDTALTILEHIQSIEKKDFGVFKLSLEMKTWLSKLAEEREMPVNIRRLPILTKRFKAHIICISKAAPCLSWIQQLCECLGDWMKRIKELSRSTQQLDSESPPAKALIAVLNEKETYRDSKSKDINEEDLKKAKDWSSRYTALQQNKKLALHDWFRLSFGRRQLKFTQKALRTEDEPYLSDNDLSEIPLSDGEVSKDECDMCLGLSYRRGLRKSLFEKPRSQLMLKLGGDLWSFSTNPPPVFIKHLEQLISLASISQLQKMASESLARLLSLRSGLPKHPDKSEVVDDLGGRQGVERLIGSLDDLLVNCVDAFEPFGDLYSTFQKLKEKVEEIHFTYNKGVASNSMIPCSRQFMRKLKASRDRVANLASSCIQQWNKFTETCSSLSIPPSQSLNRLLDANSDYFPTETTTCDVTKVFIDFKSRLEYLSNRLDQRIPRSSIAITKDIIDQQELLKVAAQEFVQCCQEITTQTRVDTGLLSVANSLHSEVEASNELLSIARKSGTQTPDFEKRVSSIISKTLVALQCLKHLDESVEVERGMIDQLKNCASALPESCISKLEVINSSIDKLSPSCVNDILHIQSITPLLASLLNVVSLRLRHLLGLLISWLGLGEFLAQVAFRLLNEGFCKPSALQKAFEAGAPGKEGADRENNNSAANENDEGGCTSINAEGVDTSGAKDVSKELQSQEQIEGTTDHHQSREEDRNELPPEADDNGIEMPDDFDAAFDDGSGREEKDPNKDDVLDQEEDDLQDVDEQMGEAGDQPDEFNQEMWASDGEEETEEEDEKNRENADMDEGGVQDDSRSKSSKSTAVNEEPDDKSAKNDAREPEEESEVNEDGEDTTTGAKEKDFSSAANANKSETVAGSENKEEGEVEEKEMANAMKDDENRLASQEAELLETEKQNEEEVEGTDDDSMDAFGENMDLEPNPEEFEDMDDSQIPDEEIDLKAQPMELEEDDKEEDKSDEMEVGGTEETGKTNPLGDQMVSNYSPGAGDLNTGNTGACDQNSGDIENQDSVVTGEIEATEQGTQNNEKQQQSQAGGLGKETGDFSSGVPSIPNHGNSAEPPSSRRKQRGPRPTSDQRTNTLGDKANQQPLRKPEILEASNSEPIQEPEAGGEGEVEAVQHITDENASASLTAFDSATDAQQKELEEENVGISENPDEKSEKPGTDPNQLQSMPEEKTDEVVVAESKLPPISNNSSHQDRDSNNSNSAGNEVRTLPKLDMELIATQGAQRPSNSTFNTILPPSTLPDVPSQWLVPLPPPPPPPQMRRQYANSEEDRELVTSAALDWSAYVARSSGLSVQLCEALRQVLEPTRASRMKGDFRTGKRLNMRKIVPYLASQFRKDKIWMRRTQPNQRDYKILIAVDNSSSMADNLCKSMTFEALATVINALNLLEAGKIGVCSFGESVEVVRGMGEPWTNEMGASMLTKFDFKQSRTSLIQLLQTSISLMQAAGEGSATSRGVPASQLLLILSDGVFSEDPQSPALQAAVRLARDHHLFIVCIIIDDNKKKHSIFDLRRYTDQGKLLPYMDVFPLPFYLVLRDVTALPQLLVEALRQWFELASATTEGSGSPLNGVSS
nr:midasin [Hymenolepis microstoma]